MRLAPHRLLPPSPLGSTLSRAYYAELISRLAAGEASTKDDVHKIKVELARRHEMSAIPSDADVWNEASGELKERLRSLLTIKRTRSISGVAVVAVMTSPAYCPHGTCLYCPGGPDWERPAAQAYTGLEPAGARGLRNDFDPFKQTYGRLHEIERMGHPIDKVDLIVMGGTITSRAVAYQEGFVKGCLDAMNCVDGGEPAPTLEESVSRNEEARVRCVGMTLETRPDQCSPQQIQKALEMGATRFELGVQSTRDDVLRNVARGHDVQATIDATRRLKDAGLKVGYHMMPGLPGSSRERDIASFRRIFEDPDFRPDMLKIYPTLVIAGTGLYEFWKRGKYHAMTTEEATDLVREVMSFVPTWARIMRVDRDIPTTEVEAGVMKSNLRELAEEDGNCRCIRCREAGHKARRGIHVDPGSVGEYEEVYEAAGGKEYFLTVEDRSQDILLAYLRLRVPSEGSAALGAPHLSCAPGHAFVREVKVLGHHVAISDAPEAGELQHRGYGRRLLERAEGIARGDGVRRLLVTSGVGARAYYGKLGYERVGTYMGRTLA